MEYTCQNYMSLKTLKIMFETGSYYVAQMILKLMTILRLISLCVQITGMSFPDQALLDF